MADGECFAEAARAVGCPHAPAPGLGLGPPLGWKERLKAGLANSGSTLWFLAGLGLLYALRVPLRLCDNVTAGERPQTSWTVGDKHQRSEILGESWRALEKESVLHAPVGYYYYFFFLLGHNNRAADCQTCAAVCRPLPRALKARPLYYRRKSYLTNCKLQVVRQKRAFPDTDTQFIYILSICRAPLKSCL